MADRLLVLEDAPSQLRIIESSFLYPISYATIPREGEEGAGRKLFGPGKPLVALIIVDFRAFTPAHFQLLQEVRATRPLMPMIVLAPFGEEALRERLYRIGGCEVLYRPVEVGRLTHSIQTQLKMHRMSSLIARLERQASGTMRLGDMVGNSSCLRHVLSMAEHVHQTRKPALIEGENGTGKTLLARVIHGCAGRASPFVVLDCENLPERSAEHFIFAPDIGKLDEAQDGTLFLREIGGLPPDLQQPLLDALLRNEGRWRILCSSSVALEPLIRSGGFSHALYRHVRQCYIPMPSLQERREDIPLLAEHLLRIHTARENKYIRRFSDDALRAMTAAEWPGNVAQLSNLVWRCCMLCNEDTIDAGTLRLVQQLEPVHYAGQMQLMTGDMPSLVDAQGRIKKLKFIEEEAIRYALRHYGGSMTKAAASLGIGRSTLYRRMVSTPLGDYVPRANQTTRPIMRISSGDLS